MSYSSISDQFDAILLPSLHNGPLPIDFDSVDDPLLVEVVDGGGEVVQPLLVDDQVTEGLGREGVAAQGGDDLQGRVLGAEHF